jgi:hypothetical protein
MFGTRAITAKRCVLGRCYAYFSTVWPFTSCVSGIVGCVCYVKVTSASEGQNNNFQMCRLTKVRSFGCDDDSKCLLFWELAQLIHTSKKQMNWHCLARVCCCPELFTDHQTTMQSQRQVHATTVVEHDLLLDYILDVTLMLYLRWLNMWVWRRLLTWALLNHENFQQLPSFKTCPMYSRSWSWLHRVIW